MGLLEALLEVAVAGATGGVVGWTLHWLTSGRGGPHSFPVTNSSEGPGPYGGALAAVNDVSGPTLAALAGPPVEAPGPRRTALRATEGAGLAGRVIIHLAQTGRVGPDEVARLGHTQLGMSDALRVRQGSLAKVLQRLEAADVLTVDRRHVSGSDRRRKVYRLTPLGESVARDLRRPSTGSPPVGETAAAAVAPR